MRVNLRRTTVLWLAVISAAAFLLLALLVAGQADPLVRFDAWVSAGAHTAALAHPHWRSVMAGVTMTGSTVVLGLLVALGCLILLVRGRVRQAVFAVVATLAVLWLRLIPLAIVARTRPVEQLAPASNDSFPSGHTTASSAVALILVLVCWPLLNRPWARIVLAVTAGLWALAVGVSRVALVVHWPTDVLGAWLFVLPIVLALFRLLPADERAGRTPAEPPPRTEARS